VSGCFDKKLRIWNIPHERVVEWTHTPHMVTAAIFSPTGEFAIAGLYQGQCVFYKTERALRYHTQIDCRNAHGSNRKGKKVTGMAFVPGAAGAGELLVTTNDSRMRLYQTEDFSQTYKYKGMVNNQMQIRAVFSQDGDKIICGSETGSVYVWDTHSQYVPTKMGSLMAKKDRNESYEFFQATSARPPIMTAAAFAPASTFVMARPELLVAVEAETMCQRLIVATDYAGAIRVYENTDSAAAQGKKR
jgi:WD repeat-containing protein 44